MWNKFLPLKPLFNVLKQLSKPINQERLLEESAKELEDTILKEAAIRKALQEKEAERMDIEEKYSSLQEEASGKTRFEFNAIS